MTAQKALSSRIGVYRFQIGTQARCPRQERERGSRPLLTLRNRLPEPSDVRILGQHRLPKNGEKLKEEPDTEEQFRPPRPGRRPVQLAEEDREASERARGSAGGFR